MIGHALLFLGGFSIDLLQALQHMKQFTKMLRDFKVLDQHLKGQDDEEAKLEPDLSETGHLKVEYDSESDDSNDDFEEADDGFTEDVKPVESEKSALLAQVLPESPVNHSQEFLDKKVARTQALTCSHCQFIAKSFERLKSHSRRFHETEWPCDQCAMVLRTEGKLRKHIMAKHESLRSKGMCDVAGCDFVTRHPSKLNVHKRKEHGGDKFYCNQCDFNKWERHIVEKHKAANMRESCITATNVMLLTLLMRGFGDTRLLCTMGKGWSVPTVITKPQQMEI